MNSFIGMLLLSTHLLNLIFANWSWLRYYTIYITIGRRYPNLLGGKLLIFYMYLLI